MKKLLIFGASGPTGKQLVDQALQAGYEVTAVVRDPVKLSIKHERLKIVKGDALKRETFSQYVAGKDALLSALGATERKVTTIYSKGAENMVDEMKIAGVKRLIVITSATIGVKDAIGPGWFMRWMVGTMLYNLLKEAYEDMKRMEKYLSGVDLDWTVIRPTRLKDKPLTGKYTIVMNKNEVKGWEIARADVAHYMLSIIDDTAISKAIAIITN